MAYYNWFNTYFKEKHKTSTTEEKLNDVFALLESRGNEYLKHNYETYKQLWIDPNEDIVNSKPQIIQQIREELYDFLKLIIETDTKKVLQIGLGHFGSTHFCLSLICDEVVTIEYDIKNIANYANRELFYNQNKEHFIYGSSVDLDTINKAKQFGEFDAVFIDGNHSYEYVKLDWQNYSPLVKKGGIVSFHDACLDAERYGTPKVLKEIGNEISLIRYSKEVGIAYYIKD